ncbi:exosortase [Thalassotalea agarivorans]|uniref:Exosortase A n=1 Tax=Thalassotalea agarivorans TaxID=349064 RepID=A0A1I0DW78_THASX|nr:exosortase [Thalassotalea agarivorans]SET36488.1 exosortase A [Thalassotalea agarivorans]
MMEALAIRKGNGRRQFIVLMAILTVFALINLPILNTLWRHSFDDGTYSHAYLVPFISIFLYIKLAQKGFLQFRSQPNYLVSAFVVMSQLLLFISINAQITLGYWFGFLLTTNLLVFVVFSFNARVLFAGALLIFIFPFYGALLPILQTISVEAVSIMLSFTSVPAYIDPPYVEVPGGAFEIAHGCSGLRYLIVATAISALYCFLYIKRPKNMVIFFSTALLFAFLTNWIRITALILIGHYTNMESDIIRDHNNFGWYIFIPFIIALFYIGNRLSDHDFLDDENKEHSAQPLTLRYHHLMLLLIVVATSSVTKQFATMEQQNLATEVPFPESIYGIANAKALAPSMQGFAVVYEITFNPSDLDAKPTNYANKYEPANSRLLASERMQGWQVSKVVYNNKTAVIAYQYKLGIETRSTPSGYKKLRLANGFNPRQAPILQWGIAYCGEGEPLWLTQLCQ